MLFRSYVAFGFVLSIPVIAPLFSTPMYIEPPSRLFKNATTSFSKPSVAMALSSIL
jgi:hypothetical protein